MRDTDLEGLRDRLRSEDKRKRPAAKRRGTVMDDGDDADFATLYDLVNNTKLPEDEGLRALRKLVNDYHQRRPIHAALDRVLEKQRNRGRK